MKVGSMVAQMEQLKAVLMVAYLAVLMVDQLENPMVDQMVASMENLKAVRLVLQWVGSTVGQLARRMVVLLVASSGNLTVDQLGHPLVWKMAVRWGGDLAVQKGFSKGD